MIFQVLFEMEDITTAICRALEAMVVLQVNCNRKIMTYFANTSCNKEEYNGDHHSKPKTTSHAYAEEYKSEYYTYFPVIHQISQLQCIFHISQLVLRIEKVCSISKIIKDKTYNS